MAPSASLSAQVVRLLATTTSPRSDGRKLLTTEVDPKAVAVVSGGPVLRVGQSVRGEGRVGEGGGWVVRGERCLGPNFGIKI